MRRAAPLLFLALACSCASAELRAELHEARVQRDQALLAAKEARFASDKALLEAERIRFEAEQQLLGAQACETAAPPPPPSAARTTVVQGKFVFGGGKSTVVQMHVAGMGIDEGFRSDRKGQIAIELPIGSYQVSVHAKGYRDKVFTLDVPGRGEGERFEFREKLERGRSHNR